MANVTDLYLWRAAPLSNLPRNTQYSDQSRATTSLEETWALDEEQPANQELEAVELSAVLRSLFDSGRDQVVWNLPQSTPPGQQYLRLDPRHGFAPAIARSLSKSISTAGATSELQPWLIIVGDAREMLDVENLEHLRTAVLQLPRILIVACDTETRDHQRSDVTTRQAIEASAILHCRHTGPIAHDDSAGLNEALLNIKRSGQPTLLHLQIHDATAEAGRAARPADAARSSESFLQLASRQLAALALADERIVAVSAIAGREIDAPWAPIADRMLSVDADVSHALQWCASVAHGTSRPFAFLNWEDLQNNLGELRQSICLKQAAVTLVVAAASSPAGPTTASLAGVRQLPRLSILSPKDELELNEMLKWCAGQYDPAIIYLPQADLAPPPPEPCPPVLAGRSEVLGTTGDVLVVAWGSTVAPAQAAAVQLAQMGIRAAVVNARFAQPLDVETLVRSAHDALCVVLVDDADVPGGFAGWVLESLLREGVTQPICIAAPAARERADGGDNAPVDRTASTITASIVEHCRWLAEPIDQDVAVAPSTPVITHKVESPSESWLASFGEQGDRAARERSQVLDRQLSADACRWVAAYESVGRRDLYLWKWCMHGVEITTLPCVVQELRSHVCDTKLLSIVLCVLLDDVADQHGDSQLLDALLEMMCWGVRRSQRGLSKTAKKHAKLTRDLWAEYQARVATYPCYPTFGPVLRYDLLQFFNTMRYSHLVNGRPYLLNMVEHDLYTSHNMMMISFAMLDLMCSPGFPQGEVGILRETMWHAQNMGRIGNLLSTWRRELQDRDFTSGVFARALMEGDLSLEQLEKGDPAQIEATIRNRGHEAHFFQKWLDHRQCCHERARRIRSLDMTSVLDGHDRFFAMHLGSQGLI